MQEEIVDSVLAGRDTLGLLPTGGGKSITFQVPALMMPGLTLVVTPLISLMKDQVDNLRERGVRAVLFHSGLSAREKELAMTRCRLGKVKLAYLSPERLQNEQFTAQLKGVDISMIVVDEAHCISQWGYDFRPPYLRIADLRRKVCPGVPVLALTASATPEVRADIVRLLGMRDPAVFVKSFARPNISYVVRHDDVKERMLLRVLRATSGCAIVYVRSRRRTHELARLLASEGISAEAYHAGLDPEEKNLRQNRWKEGEVRVIVATNAFGMGIDKPDVRTVVHVDLPSSLEEYYQEAGRAGRDGEPSYAVAIVARRDKGVLTRRLGEAFPEPEFIGHVYEMACNFLDIAVGSGYGRTFEFDLEKFCRTYNLPPVAAHSALGILTRAGYVEYSDDADSSARAMVIMPRHELYALDLDERAERVFNALLRAYPGLFADYVKISELRLARDTGLSTQEIYETLLMLGRMHAVHYIPRRVLPYLYMTTSREEPRYLVLPREVYEDRRARMAERIEAVKRFAFDSTECRARTILAYFGETDAEDCGVCDVCRSRRRSEGPDEEEVRERIIMQASSAEGLPLASIERYPEGTRTLIVDLVRLLTDGGILVLRDGVLRLAEGV